MKWIIALSVGILGSTGLVQAQSGVKLYGYQQAVTRGMAGRERDENGKVVRKEQSPMYNYQIYLTSNYKGRIYPIELWIKGERKGVKAETVTTTPVTMVQNDGTTEPKKIVLVPATRSKVWLLTGTTVPPQKQFTKAKTLAASNELVLVYKRNGSFQYATLKKLTVLGSAVLQ